MTRSILLASLLLLAAPMAAQATDYTILIYETPMQVALRDAKDARGAAYWQAFAAYGKALAEAGILRGGAALSTAPNPDATTPTGYFVIDVATPDDARAWAAKAPSIAHGGGAVARAHLPMAGK